MSRRLRMLAWGGNVVIALLASQCSSTSSTEEPDDSEAKPDASKPNKSDPKKDSGSDARPNDEAGSQFCGNAKELTTYKADDPNIAYSGRVDFSNAKEPVYSAAGATVTAKFRGKAFSILFKDEFRYPDTRNFYDVVLDGKVLSKIQPEEGKTSYDFTASGCGEHVVQFVKRTEPNIGKTNFMGFKFEEILSPPKKPEHRIEVIGDSITCGAGADADKDEDLQKEQCGCAFDLVDGTCPKSGWGQPFHDAYKAYGTVVANKLGAEIHTTCVSGVGLVRDYSSQYDTRPLPQVYKLLHLEDPDGSQEWDTDRYVPDAILISLGTNDFSPGDAPADAPRPLMTVAEFSAKYIEFINTLHSYYPNAHFFLLQSPMLGDGWPSAEYTSRTSQWEAIQYVVQQFASGGQTADAGTADASPTEKDGAVEGGSLEGGAKTDAKADANTTAKTDAEADAKVIPVVQPTAGVKVESIGGDQIYPGYGCGSHPSASQQAELGNKIAPIIKSRMGW